MGSSWGKAGSVSYCVQKLLRKESGHGKRLIVKVDLLTKERHHDHPDKTRTFHLGMKPEIRLGKRGGFSRQNESRLGAHSSHEPFSFSQSSGCVCSTGPSWWEELPGAASRRL